MKLLDKIELARHYAELSSLEKTNIPACMTIFVNTFAEDYQKDYFHKVCKIWSN